MTNSSNAAETNAELESEVAQLIVSSLNLEVEPQNIEADSDLYGDGQQVAENQVRSADDGDCRNHQQPREAGHLVRFSAM